METKICLVCGTEFIPNKSRKQIFCTRKCKCKKHQVSKESQNKHYSKLVPFLLHLKRLKRYDRDLLSIEFLESLYIKQKGLCAISGIPMTHIRGSGKVQTNISIDRIDSNIGYIPENTQLVCAIVNRMKAEQSMEELFWWCKQINKNAGEK